MTETGSLILKAVLKLYKTVNRFYEASFTYALMLKLGGFFKGSILVQAFESLIFVKDKREYALGSKLYALLLFVMQKLTAFSQSLYKLFGVEYSVTKKVITGSMLNYKGKILEYGICAFFILMAAVPHEYWNNLYIFYAAAFFMLVYLIQVAAGKRTLFKFKQVSPALLVFTLLAFVSVITGYGGGDGLRVFVLLFSSIIFSVLVQAVITSKQTLRLVVVSLFLAMLVSSLFGLYQYKMGVAVRLDFTDTTVSAGVARLFSTMDNPNNYAEFLMLIIPLGVAFILSQKKDIYRLISAMLILPGVAALVLTNSRSAYLAFVIGFALFVALLNKRLIPFAIILFIAFIPFIPQSITARLMTIGKDSSSEFRVLIWEGALRTLKNHWFYGIGIGPTAFSRIYKIYAHYLALPAMHSHNLFLQVWIETGIFGFVSFVVLIFTTIKGAIITAKKSIDAELKYYAAALATALASVLAISMVEYIWFYPRIMLSFWVLMGICSAVSRGQLNEEEKA